MKMVKIHTMTDVKSPKIQNGRGIFIIAMETEKGTVDLTKEEKLEQVTANQAELTILIRALRRLTEPCEIIVYTESAYVKAGSEDWMAGWKAAGWIKQDGQPVKNAAEWQELDRLLEGSNVGVKLQEEHPYRNWMQMELRRK